MRVLLLHNTQHDLPAVESVLAAEGFVVHSMAATAATLHAEVERCNPELILIAVDEAERDVVEQICGTVQFRERAIVLFTEDDDPVAMRTAIQARVSAYVVAGMQPKRLRSVIGVALERFKQDQLQMAQIAQIDAARRSGEATQARERSVARAKALLRRRGMSEPDAYALLRTQAMRERCSLAEVAERVLAGAYTKQGEFIAIRNINLRVQRGEFVSLIGHSGCGKSTLLNLIAGLDVATHGVLVCAGREISGAGPDRGFVFQNHSLLPWLSCFDNVLLAVERVFGATEAKSQLKTRTETALKMVGLSHAMHKHPNEISGGMKQRVGIARALSIEPDVLLLDEPFGALAALTRAHLQDELMRIVAETKSTVVMVTHDVDEAVLLSDKIVMMTNGPAATIGEILEVKLAKPRDRLALAENTDYHHYRKAVVEFLYAKQRKAA